MVAQGAEIHVIRARSLEQAYGVPVRARHGGYLYVIDGDVDVNLERLGTHDAARVVG